MTLVEVEGGHTIQETYESLDIHPGQSAAVLITLRNIPKDYYFVASSRFTDPVLTATGIIRYEGSSIPPSKPLPIGPTYERHWSMKQARTIRFSSRSLFACLFSIHSLSSQIKYISYLH